MSDPDVAAAATFLRSIFGEVEGEDAAAERLGTARFTFFGVHLLERLVLRGLELGAFPDVYAYAREARGRAGELPVPQWLIEGLVRAARGEPQLMAGVDPEQMIDVAGFVVRDLADLLALPPDELSALIDEVAHVPVPVQVRELS